MIARLAGIAGTAALLLAAAPAAAVTVVYSASDDGAGTSSAFVNSRAAETEFLSAAATFGAVVTDGFEAMRPGLTPTIALTGGSIATRSPDRGPRTSGVQKRTFGKDNGFNTTVGGEMWFGFPDFEAASATFTFAAPTHSFGLWFTGVQREQFGSTVSLTQLDGSLLTFAIPANVNGGASFFGFTDTRGFTGLLLTLRSRADAWGIDDVSYNVGDRDVPEPATWLLMIAGFGLVGTAMRRRAGALA